MQVCVVGTGYVGLVTGVCLAHIGHNVLCIDNNAEKVKLMQSGQSPIFEPGLSELMMENMKADRLNFSTQLKVAILDSEIIFIAVGTPALPSGETDTRYIEAVARGIGENLDNRYRIVVNKSTVPIGSGDWVRMIIVEGYAQHHNCDTTEAEAALQFDVVSNPEFLREGSAVYDTFNPDRIVLGGNSPEALSQMQTLYQPLIERKFSEDPSLPEISVVLTDLSSAEMIKYAANAFLATKISFINEVANICDRVGADVTEVAQGMGLDSRIGTKFLNAGIGWGGSCFPKDVSALIHTAKDYGFNSRLLNAAVEVNQMQKRVVVEKLQQELKILKGKVVGLLGLTFKPNTDDMRDAPALEIIQQLNHLGAKVKAFDPIVSQSGVSHGISGVKIEPNPETLADGCDALVLVTEWQIFQDIDFAALSQRMTQPLMIDGRNFLDKTQLESQGFRYVGIGR